MDEIVMSEALLLSVAKITEFASVKVENFNANS